MLLKRSEVFDKLLHNEVKIFFLTINSSVMEIVLEYIYIYTDSNKGEQLIEDNIAEIFHAVEHFQLEFYYEYF